MKTKILFAATCLLIISLKVNAQSSPIVSGGFSSSIQVSSGNIQSSNREFSNNGCCQSNYSVNYNNQGNCCGNHHHGLKGKHKHKNKHHDCCKHHDNKCDNGRGRDNDRDCCRRDD